MSAGAQISWDETPAAAPQIQWDDQAVAQKPDQPGFFARASERLLGTQHPVDQAMTEAKFAYEHPGEAAKQTIRGVGQDLYGLATMPAHPIKATGGEEFAQDVANRNYRGAAGTLAGDVLPMVIASPEARSTVAGAPAAIREAASGIPDATARALRTEKGALRPSVRSIARAGGAAAGTAIGGTPGGVVGALSGPSVLDAITPKRAPMPEPIEGPPFGGTSTRPSAVSALPEMQQPPLPGPAPAASQVAPPNVRFVRQFEKPAPVEGPSFGGTPTSASAVSAMPDRQPPPAVAPPGGAAPAAAQAQPPGPRFVSQFEKPKAPTPSIIAAPDSPPPPTKVTYQSYPRETLSQMAARGDVNAVRELQRNPGGYGLPPNARYLIEPNSPSQSFRNYTAEGTAERPSVIAAPGAFTTPREVIRFPQEEAEGTGIAAPDATPGQEKQAVAPPTAPVARASRPKAVPVRQQYAPDIIEEAENQMRGAVQLGDSLPQPGRYFDEYDRPVFAQYQDINNGERGMGKWRGVGAQKPTIAGQFPWMSDPNINVSRVRTAVERGSGADYERIVGKIADGIAKERATATEAISGDIPTLRDLAQRVGPIDLELAQHLTDLADGKTTLAPEALKSYVKERIADANTAAAFNEAIDDLSASTAESRASETQQATHSPRSEADETELNEPRERPR